MREAKVDPIIDTRLQPLGSQATGFRQMLRVPILRVAWPADCGRRQVERRVTPFPESNIEAECGGGDSALQNNNKPL